MRGQKIIEGFNVTYPSEIFGINQAQVNPDHFSMPGYDNDSISSMRSAAEDGDAVVDELGGSLVDAYEVINELEQLALDMFDRLPSEEQKDFIFIGNNKQRQAVIKKFLLVDHLANL